MEPNFKLLLDEMVGLNRRFDAHDDRWNRWFLDLERGLNDRASAVDSRITVLEESLTANSNDLARPCRQVGGGSFCSRRFGGGVPPHHLGGQLHRP